MSDEGEIRETIQAYFDCMYESSADKAKAVFHPAAWITGYMNGELAQMSVDDFAGFVAGQPSAKENGEPARLDVLSVEIAGDTAVARVRDDYLGLTFLDTLSLLKSDGRWRIYNKLFHVEGPAG
ncbi:MAG: nuclear transport factor 2 family protein [Pseudomonadales bacterium]|jgi:hypothetical protein